MLNKILVSFDGSEESYKAFDFALEMTKLCIGASPEITVLSVAQPPEPADIVEVDAIIDSATQHYEDLFKKLRETASKKDLEIKTEVVVGHPAEQIVKYASEKKSHLIIIGQRGKTKVTRWLLGSVSKRVATYAPCTVTIVK
jgi:nucleotide-binding universal stress UspA family protein